jgi:hypothetical protein
MTNEEIGTTAGPRKFWLISWLSRRKSKASNGVNGTAGESIVERVVEAARYDIPASHTELTQDRIIADTTELTDDIAEDSPDIADDIPFEARDPHADVLRPGHYSPRNVMSAAEESLLREKLSAKGVRLLPFSFGSAVAVVSDVDASSRMRYEGYVGTLVDKHGLDFGDSIWLCWQYMDKQKSGGAFGFFSRFFSIGHDEPERLFDETRTFNESILEFHSGNVDHFHSFLARGPRVSILDQFTTNQDGSIEARIGQVQWSGNWNCRSLYVLGVCAVASAGQPLTARSVTIYDKDGKPFTNYMAAPYDPPANGREYKLFIALDPPEANAPVPHLARVARIVVEFDDSAHAANLERLLLLNAHGEIIMHRLKLLRDSYKVETNLVTDHGGLHFRNPPRQRPADVKMKKHIASYRGPTEAYNGRLVDDDGNLLFSTDADEPHSFARVFPELTSELEFRFVVPHPAASSEGWNPFELVTPSPTRAGGGIYWARRVFPHVEVRPQNGEARPSNFWDSYSRQDTFAPRMLSVVGQVSEKPGLFWPIYTHLGSTASSAAVPGDTPKKPDAATTDEGSRDQSPYFDPTAIAALQDHVFNISGNVPAGSRVWFTRATVMYDYALMLRSIAEHVERPDENTVSITSWLDPVLGKTLPRSPGQLYGLTFHVKDLVKARVLLDGRELSHLVRNPNDVAGRSSVTIGECDIRHIVFAKLDPVANAPDEVVFQGLKWHWEPARGERTPYARLSIVKSGGGESSGKLARLPLHSWIPTGAQLLTFSIKIDQGMSFGLVFKTQTGGSFYFGDKSVPPQLFRNATASYFFRPLDRAPGSWRTLTVPFHDLVWSRTAVPGGPMPNHALTSLTIVCTGPQGASFRLRELMFLRPRSMAETEASSGRYCLGGMIPGSTPGQTVYAQAQVDGGEFERKSALVDQRGYFCFGCVPEGIYRVWSTPGGLEIQDRRGPLVEVGSNVMDLVLRRRAKRSESGSITAEAAA